MKSYLVKPGQRKDSPIRYTPPWTETEIAELEALYKGQKAEQESDPSGERD